MKKPPYQIKRRDYSICSDGVYINGYRSNGNVVWLAKFNKNFCGVAYTVGKFDVKLYELSSPQYKSLREVTNSITEWISQYNEEDARYIESVISKNYNTITRLINGLAGESIWL